MMGLRERAGGADRSPGEPPQRAYRPPVDSFDKSVVRVCAT